jgi:hypothetical protein
MKTTTLPNGNLELSLEESDDKEDILEHCRGYNWVNLFEYEFCNGWLAVQPEWIGALTDAPILTDGFMYIDDVTPNITGRVWWYPNYMVSDPAEVLCEEGKVVFTLAKQESEES